MHPVFGVHFGSLRQMVCLKPVVAFVSKQHYKSSMEWPQDQNITVEGLFSYCCCLMLTLDVHIHQLG